MDTLTSFSAKEASLSDRLGEDVQATKVVESKTSHEKTLRKIGDLIPFSL